VTPYRDHEIIFHVDGGYIIIRDKVVLYAALTLEEAKAWIDAKLDDPNGLHGPGRPD